MLVIPERSGRGDLSKLPLRFSSVSNDKLENDDGTVPLMSKSMRRLQKQGQDARATTRLSGRRTGRADSTNFRVERELVDLNTIQ